MCGAKNVRGERCARVGKRIRKWDGGRRRRMWGNEKGKRVSAKTERRRVKAPLKKETSFDFERKAHFRK